MTTCYVTRTGRQADALKRQGKIAYPVFACLAGMRFDEVIITFDVNDPIPYKPDEDSDITRRHAELIRKEERLALAEYWPCKLRIPGEITYRKLDDAEIFQSD